MTTHLMGIVLSTDQEPAGSHAETVETTATHSLSLSTDIPLERADFLERKSHQNQLSRYSRLFWRPILKFVWKKDPCFCLQSSLPMSQILDHQQQFLICFCFTLKQEPEIEIQMTSQYMLVEASMLTIS